MNPLFLKVGIFLAMLGAAYIAGCTHEKERFEEYKTSVQAISKANDDARKARNAARKQARMKADEDAKNERNKLNATVSGLRKQLAGYQFVTGPDAHSERPDLACYRRGELTNALGTFITGVTGLIEEGAGAIVDLNTAKEWAKTVKEVE